MGRGAPRRGGSCIKNAGFTPQLDASRSKNNNAVDHQNSSVYLLFISDPPRMSVALAARPAPEMKMVALDDPLPLHCRSSIVDPRPSRFHGPHDCVSHFNIRQHDRAVRRRAAFPCRPACSAGCVTRGTFWKSGRLCCWAESSTVLWHKTLLW